MNVSLIIFTLLLPYDAKFNVCNNWTFTFKIGLVFTITLVVKKLDSQYRMSDSNLLGGSRSRSFQPFIQLKLIK